MTTVVQQNMEIIHVNINIFNKNETFDEQNNWDNAHS